QLRKNISVKEAGILISAYDNYLGREVVLKKNRFVSRKESTSQTQQMELDCLKREASITAILEHPNIVPIYDFQENSSDESYFNSESYFTMRKIEGHSLKEFLKPLHEKPLDYDENRVLTLYLKICDAIRYAHSRQVVHLNLNPENIWVGAFGEVYVMNWGKAQFQEQRSALQETVDIEALGKILKECFLQTSPEIEAIINKASDPDWQKRYTSVEALMEEIERYQNHMQILVKEYGPLEAFGKWIQRNPQKVKAGILFLVALFLFSGYLSWKENADRETSFQNYYAEAKRYRQQAEKFLETDKEKLGQKLEFLYQSLNALHRALTLNPQKESLYQELFETGQDLIRICCLTTDYHLAQFILREIQKLKKVPEEYKIRLLNQFLESKNATAQKYLQRLSLLENQFKTLKQNKEERDNARFEISRMRGNLVQQQLLHLLQEGTQYILKDSPDLNMIQFYFLIVEAIGRSENREYSKPLLEALRTLYDEIKKHPIEEEISSIKTEYIIVVAYALKDLNAIEFAEELRGFSMLMQAYYRTSVSHRLAEVLEKLSQGSILYYSKWIETNPQSASAYYFRGLAYTEQNEIESAFQNFERAIQLNPNYADAYFNRGNIKIKRGEIQSAIDDFTKAIQLSPNSWEIYTNRGNARELQKNFSGALEDHTEAIRLNPTSADCYNNRGMTKHSIDDLNGALEDYTEAIRLNPQLSEVYNNRGRVQRDQGFLERAIEDFSEAIRLNSYQPEAYINRGMSKLLQKDFQGAIQDLTELIRIHPQYEPAYQGRGLIKQEQGDIEGAIQDFTESIRLLPSSDSYSLRGLAKLNKEEFEDAIQDFSKVIELKPEDFIAYHNRGVCKSHLKDFEEAILDYTASIQRNPNFANAYYTRGLDRETLQDIEGALEDYTSAIRLNSQGTEPYYQRGILRRQLGDLKRALEDLSEVIRLDPQFVDAYYQRGMAYGRRFQDQAKRDFKVFLEFTKNKIEPEIQEQRNAILKSFPELK
ncbi:MAG: tetratricopeptide repeat protein, partial [Planctomycetota bacterium]